MNRRGRACPTLVREQDYVRCGQARKGDSKPSPHNHGKPQPYMMLTGSTSIITSRVWTPDRSQWSASCFSSA